MSMMEIITRLIRLGQFSIKNFFRWPPGHQLALEPSITGFFPSITQEPVEQEDKRSEGFLWGVPKRRRSTEARWCRKMGAENWTTGWKMLRPKTNLLICFSCGHHYEAKHLCRNCYDKVMAETKLIRQTAEAQLSDNPEDKNIIVLYANENERLGSEAKENNVLVELEKPRPKWFSNNLLQKSTTGPDTTTTTVTVPPKNLG